jgi:hypothetical protein
MPLTVKEFDRVVRKLEMKLREGKHRLVWFQHGGKNILFTERSHGRGEVGAVEHAIRRQLRVNPKQFKDLINCPMTRNMYVEHLKLIGAIVDEP